VSPPLRRKYDVTSTELDLPTFADLPLRPELLAVVEELGYTHPSPVQAEAIAPLVEGRDLIGRFLAEIAFRDGRTYRLIATRANGQLAFGAYLHGLRAEATPANGLLVLTLTGCRIRAMTRFGDSVLPRFGLPPS